MKNLFTENFEGEEICTFVWNDKICWIAYSVGDVLGYSEPSKAIFQCIAKEDFEKGIEYDILTGNELKEFKAIAMYGITSIKYASKLLILYEKGLYGFLHFSGKPKAIEFKKWLRREVIPEIRETGAYVLGDSNFDDLLEDDIKGDLEQNKLSDNTKKMLNKLRDTINNESGFDVDKFQRIRTTLEMIKVFKELLDNMTDDVTYKFEFLKAICTEAGMALPIFTDGDDVI